MYACFVDLKKASDSIWHESLLLKLFENMIARHFYELIKDMYSKCKCFLKLGSKLTKTFACSRGVRQGCILSPLLFSFIAVICLKSLTVLLEQILFIC